MQRRAQSPTTLSGESSLCSIASASACASLACRFMALATLGSFETHQSMRERQRPTMPGTLAPRKVCAYLRSIVTRLAHTIGSWADGSLP